VKDDVSFPFSLHELRLKKSTYFWTKQYSTTNKYQRGISLFVQETECLHQIQVQVPAIFAGNQQIKLKR
jgi:hypothetical protein